MCEVLNGILLIGEAPAGRAMGYALLPFELVFWIGFSLPVGPMLGAARTVLLLRA